jgi:hypothetical protein
LTLKGIGEKATSNEFLVPFLSFVGSALASQRPTLGGALGEGLIGGVAGYQQNREIQAKLAKGVLDMIKERFTRSIDDNGQTIWFDKYRGKRATADQIESVYAENLRAVGVNPASYGLGVGAGAPTAITPPGAPAVPTAPGAKPAEGAPSEKTAEGTPGQKAQGSKTWMETPPDKVNLIGKSQTQIEEYIERHADHYGLTGDRNPGNLRAEIAAERKRAKALSSLGDAEQMREAQSLRATADEKQRRLETYLKEASALQVGINTETAKAETQSIDEAEKASVARISAYPSQRKALQDLAIITSQLRTGPPADIKSRLEGWFTGLGIPVPDSLKGNSQNFDEAMKIAMTMAFTSVGDNNLARAPKEALIKAVQTIPNPTMDPGAVYSLIGKTVGEMDYLMAKDKAFNATNRSVRPSAFLLDYAEKNPKALEEATRKAFEQIPVPAGIRSDKIEQLRERYGYYEPLQAPPARRRGEAAPAAASRETTREPAAPSAPVTVRSVEEARKLDKGTKFIDPNGVLREVP